MLEELIGQEIKITSLNNKELNGYLISIEKGFLMIKNENRVYVVNLKYIGYVETIASYAEDVSDSQIQNITQTSKPRIVTNPAVTPRSNEFSMEMSEESSTYSHPQFIRKTKSEK